MTNRFRAAFAAVLTVGALGTVAACGGHGTGTISPSGYAHGTYRYCSYTPTGSGIKISHHESDPCLVNDTRSTKDRKHDTHTGHGAYAPYAIGHSAKTSPPKPTATKKSLLKKIFSRPKSAKSPKK